VESAERRKNDILPHPKGWSILKKMETNKEKYILDATASKRTFWINKEHPNTTFMDNRKEVKPEVLGDFRKMPFEDNSFNLVIFDPPHILQKEFNGKLVTHQYYGILNPETWKEDLKKGFDECFRVLKEKGTLVFKWSDCNRWANSKAKLKDVFEFIGYEPLIIERFKLSENSTTYWCIFTKQKGGLNSSQP